MSEQFDFRWGVPALDDAGYTFIPGYILRNYAKMSIKPSHMMFIAHLSSYKYNIPNSEARPSLRTIANLMGYKSVQAVRDIITKLEESGVLTVFENPGYPNIYDFSILSARCMVLDKENLTPQEFLTPTPQENLTPPLKNSGGEETETKAEKQDSTPSAKPADGGGGDSPTQPASKPTPSASGEGTPGAANGGSGGLFEFVLEKVYGLVYTPHLNLHMSTRGHVNAILGSLKDIDTTVDELTKAWAAFPEDIAKPRSAAAWAGMVVRYRAAADRAGRAPLEAFE